MTQAPGVLIAASSDRSLVAAVADPPDQIDGLIETVFQPAVAALQEEPS